MQNVLDITKCYKGMNQGAFILAELNITCALILVIFNQSEIGWNYIVMGGNRPASHHPDMMI